MKRFKYVLPILAVMGAIVVAFAFRSTADNPSPSATPPAKFATVWIQFDCAASTVGNPVPARDPNNQLINLTPTQAANLCPGGSAKWCSAEYNVGPTQPVIFNVITGKFEFNPDYTAPIQAALNIYYCP